MVTSRYLTAVSTLAMAIDENKAERVLDRDPFVSANLCESISAMQPLGEKSSLTVEAIWSTAAAGSDLPGSVKLKQRHFAGIERLGVSLRRPKDQLQKQLFVGYVAQLKGQQEPDGRMCGEAILALISSDEEEFTARISLTSNDYAKACDAHKEKYIVVVRGILKRASRLHEISEYESFKVLEADPDEIET